MKTEKNILIAFIFNICFSAFELVGGILTNSVAILSDAIHDFGDALSIGISVILEKKSKKRPDDNYTYGYARFSILGAFITTTILIIGSILVIIGAVKRFFNPEEVNYNLMIIFSIFGVIINFIALYFTKEGESLNQKSVNLHMLEDVLGWVVIFIGSFLIKITGISIFDSIMSIGVSIFIFICAVNNFKEILALFMEKTPSNISVKKIKKDLRKISGIVKVHNIHIWSLDGYTNYATMHVKTGVKDDNDLKDNIRKKLLEYKIENVTIEIENIDERCSNKKNKKTKLKGEKDEKIRR